jgi:hypothetical protein
MLHHVQSNHYLGAAMCKARLAHRISNSILLPPTMVDAANMQRNYILLPTKLQTISCRQQTLPEYNFAKSLS